MHEGVSQATSKTAAVHLWDTTTQRDIKYIYNAVI